MPSQQSEIEDFLRVFLDEIHSLKDIRLSQEEALLKMHQSLSVAMKESLQAEKSINNVCNNTSAIHVRLADIEANHITTKNLLNAIKTEGNAAYRYRKDDMLCER